MGKKGINILNGVDYITITIMNSIEGKSREYSAIRASALIESAEMGERTRPVSRPGCREKAGARGSP